MYYYCWKINIFYPDQNVTKKIANGLITYESIKLRDCEHLVLNYQLLYSVIELKMLALVCMFHFVSRQVSK